MARRKKLNEEQPSDNNDNRPENEDDTFGLPEVEYEPLKRDEQRTETPIVEEPVSSTTPPVNEPTQTYRSMEREQNTYEYSNEYNEEEEGSNWPKLLGILAILLLTGAAIWYFGFHNPKMRLAEQERLKQEQLARESEQQEAERRAQLEREAEQRRADSLANLQPKQGEILTLSERTGRYYVVVASSVDGDLVMDYAKKLAPKGVSPRIIPPHGKVKFYRLAVADGDTYEATQSTADALKSEYTDGAWVVKW